MTHRILIVAVLLAAVAVPASPANAQSRLAEVFLERPAVWEGDFQNFVHRGDGVTQNGRIRVEVLLVGDTIRMANTFLDEEGKASGYTGYTSLIREDSGLRPATIPETDENTGNVLRDYVFIGRILDEQIYIHESYVEVMEDGREEPRKNTVHYYLVDGRVVQLADIWVNGELLVIAGVELERTQAAP